METIAPTTVKDFAKAYAETYASGKVIRIEGTGSKERCAGPLAPAAVTLSTSGLDALEEYNSGDLSLRVQAGMPFRDLNNHLAECGQMLPFDPPFYDDATIGGVVASNLCGSRRRAYGTVRDYVIGIQFVDHKGNLVQSGAMVAKNVAGYDLNKLFVGSWGTLAPLVTINLRVSPVEKFNHSFAFYGVNPPELGSLRDALLKLPAEPVALDYVNAAAADKLRLDGAALLARFACHPDVIGRIRVQLAKDGFALPEALPEEPAFYVWQRIRDFLQTRSKGHPDGVVLQLSTTNSRIFHDANAMGGQVVARAASGVIYAAYRDTESALDTMQYLEAQGRYVTMQQGPQGVRKQQRLFTGNRSDIPLMRKIKDYFDPQGLLNKGRLYGCI